MARIRSRSWGIEIVACAARSMSLPIAGRNTVYGVALNYKSTLLSLGCSLSAKPYWAPPSAPVLYIKPPNTWIGPGDPIPLPTDVAAVQAGVTLAAVIGRDMCRVRPESALMHVEGFTVVNDVTVPHSDYFRPAIQNRCRDGFCPIAAQLIDPEQITALDALEMRVRVNGELVCVQSTCGLVRPVANLLADVSALFTLAAGDIVLIGSAPGAPLVRAGDRVAVEIEEFARLENPVIAEPAARLSP
jgi:5-oxopent-3-ene-1,2,5-tricarboxylate decarboxylase/2-hydroxyhepta-2,4-diene-1,7-dioate isomerase